MTQALKYLRDVGLAQTDEETRDEENSASRIGRDRRRCIRAKLNTQKEFEARKRTFPRLTAFLRIG
jgi:hypothetical protein